MTPEAFAYWCAGLFEMTEGTVADPLKVGLTPAQVQVLKDHLDLTLTKVTPDRAKPTRAPWPSILPQGGAGGTIHLPSQPTYCAPIDGSNKLCGSQPVPEETDLVLPKDAVITRFTDDPITGVSMAISQNAAGKETTMTAEAFWAKRLEAQNADKVFITISRRPSYQPGATYSYFPLHADGEPAKAQLELLRTIGVTVPSDEVYCVVDNTLKPRDTRYNGLKGDTEHLTMVGDWTGILNVGVGESHIC
jgi:hypothetical protein